MKITSREDAIEFRKLRDHIGVMFVSDNINEAERAHLHQILAQMHFILLNNGYLTNVGRADGESLDIFDGDGGWKGFL